MVGDFCLAIFPYYDVRAKKNKFKYRPILVIAEAGQNDWVTLPVSKISHKECIDLEYDIKIEPINYPLMNLTCVSYIRTHKQTVTHRASITKVIINVKKMYPGLYTRVIDKVEEKYKINIIEASS